MASKNTNLSYVPLIESWEAYITTGGLPNVEGFADWVQSKKTAAKKAEKRDELASYFDEQAASYQYAQRSSEAAFILWRLGKFIRFYTRPVLAANGLTSQDEFA